MKLKFIQQNRILEIVECTEIELKQLRQLATAKWSSWVMQKGQGRKLKKFEKSYMHQDKYLPGGFWHKVLALKKMGHSVTITNTADFVRKIDFDTFVDWANSLDTKHTPRWYQTKGAFLALKYPISRGQFATSAGKTFIMYMISRYLIEHVLAPDKKILIVVPAVMLVNQTHADFLDHPFSAAQILTDKIYSGSKRNKDAQVVIGNIDSLVNYDSDFFLDFGAVMFDEGHKVKSDSYQVIAARLNPCKLSLIYSASGTFYAPEQAEDFPAMSISGPILIDVPYALLAKEGAISPVKIKQVKLTHSAEVSEQYYNHEDCQDSNKRYHFDQKFTRSQVPRFKYIFKVIASLEYNQLLLFKTRKYCDVFFRYLKANCLDRQVMQINGDVSSNEREKIKQVTELNDNVIICATYGTMSTGVSINNLSTIHYMESSKSFIMVRQSIGRGLRLHKNKSFALLMDYFDHYPKSNREWGGPKGKNISVKHASARVKIYKQQKMEYTAKQVLL